MRYDQMAQSTQKYQQREVLWKIQFMHQGQIDFISISVYFVIQA